MFIKNINRNISLIIISTYLDVQKTKKVYSPVNTCLFEINVDPQKNSSEVASCNAQSQGHCPRLAYVPPNINSLVYFTDPHSWAFDEGIRMLVKTIDNKKKKNFGFIIKNIAEPKLLDTILCSRDFRLSSWLNRFWASFSAINLIFLVYISFLSLLVFLRSS